MKFYDVSNKAGGGFWVIARDEDHAREIAVKFKHVRKAENATPTEVELDTDNADLDYYVGAGQTGWLSKRIQMQTFQEMISGQRSRSMWVLQRDSDKMFMDPYGNEAKFGYQLPMPWGASTGAAS